MEKKMKKLITSLSIILLLTSFSPATFAASPWTQKEGYDGKLVGKLMFGLRNLVFGWTEIFMAPAAAFDSGDNVMAGFGKGLLNMVIYTVGGAANTVTFPIPFDIPLPNNGTQF
jgi:hypothetical protein